MSSWNILPNISFFGLWEVKEVSERISILRWSILFYDHCIGNLKFLGQPCQSTFPSSNTCCDSSSHIWWPYLILFQPFYLLRSACHNEHWAAACWTSKVQLGNWRAAAWYRHRILVSFLVQGLLLTGSRRDHRGRWLDLESTEPDAFLMGTIKPFACCL